MTTEEEDKKGMSDAYWRSRESADAEREGSAPDEPADDGELDVISGGAEPDPDTTTAADYPSEAMREPLPAPATALGKAIAEPKPPDARQSALEGMQRIASRRYTPSAGLSDEAIGKADEARRSEAGRNNFTRAIQAALLRKPYEPEAIESGGGSLLARRRAEQGDFERGKQQEMSAQAALARGLATGKAPQLTPYQLEQIKRNAVLDEQRRKQKEADDARHATERTEDVTDRHTAHADSVAQQQATLRLAESQFGHRQEREVQEDVKDLGKTIGGEPEHLGGLLDRLDAASQEKDIPGVGPVDKLVPDVIASDKALQNRNDMREATRIMLSMKSGKTVTPQEAEDYAKIYGINGSEEAFRQGVKRLRSDVADTLKAKKAGFTPEARKAYEAGGGAPTPAKPAAPAAKAAKDPGEWVTVKRKDTGETIRKRRSDAEAMARQFPDMVEVE